MSPRKELTSHDVTQGRSYPRGVHDDDPAFNFDDEGRWVRVIALNGLYVSGVLADDGGGWCWYCGTHHDEATTKRTPCCGDCWYDESVPEYEERLASDRR